MNKPGGVAAAAGSAPRGFVAGTALAGSVTMSLVQPPVDLWPLAWLAAVPWMLLLRVPRRFTGRDWGILWAAGLLHWLAVLHWLRLPHPATSIGWLLLSAYLGLFLPAFVWLARRAGDACGLPFVPAAMLAWVATEHLRAWLFGGFTMGGLCDTQYRCLPILQVADLFGGVGLSGLVAAVAAGVAAVVPLPGLPNRSKRAGIAAVATAAGLLAAGLGYGWWRLASEPTAAGGIEVLLVQGSIDTELKQDPAAAEMVARHYDELTTTGLLEQPGDPPDLVVWPETMWRWGLLEIDPAERLPEDLVAERLGPPAASRPDDDARRQARCRRLLAEERLEPLAAFARRYGTTWLVGLDKQLVTPEAASGYRNYNCGLFLDAQGRTLGCYEKMHPVLFGEYVPLADRYPWLYRLTPLPAGLSAGQSPVAVEVDGVLVAVNICYETTLPRAVRGMVRELEAAGRRPELIANLTNDGWFWGSSELDMHLAAAVLRAVEVRTPIVVAANTGISAWIDGSGRVLARGPKRATATLRVRPAADGRTSPFLIWGTLPTGLVATAAGIVLLWQSVAGLKIARRGPRGSRLEPSSSPTAGGGF